MAIVFAMGCTSRKPSGHMTPAKSFSYFDVQGHRGARGLLPENTIPAFLKALELGVTTLELDVVIAGDGTVVVSHEPWMSATICTQPNGKSVLAGQEQSHRILEMTYDEVAAYDCGSRGNPRFPRQQPVKVAKPRLYDVIETAEAYVAEHGLRPVGYNIETKARPEWDGVFTPEPVPFTCALYEVLVATGVKDRAVLQSFDVRTLHVGKRLDPDWMLSLLVDQREDQGVATNLEALGFTPDIYSPHYALVDAALVEAVHSRGMILLPWTVNMLGEMKRLKALGVDGLITDFPDIGVTLLAQ